MLFCGFRFRPLCVSLEFMALGTYPFKGRLWCGECVVVVVCGCVLRCVDVGQQLVEDYIVSTFPGIEPG